MVVHVYNRILHSRKKEGAPTLRESMDGTGEHYAKWNKQGVKDKYHMMSHINGTLSTKQTRKQNTTRYNETKNKLTVTRGEVGRDKTKEEFEAKWS